jgi:hypothetical protein
MKKKIAIFALAMLCSVPAFAARRQCEPWLCGTTVVAPANGMGASHAWMWPPGPTLWGFVMTAFGG